MARFGMIPPEPARTSSLDDVAPLFRAAVERVLAAMQARGHDPVVFESLRTAERSAWLYGFGRDYDDGRGEVTNIAPAIRSWHFYGLAADVISIAQEWNAPGAFWTDLISCAEAEGLTSGDDWDRDGIPDDTQGKSCIDKPHVQWFVDGMHVSPSPAAAALFAQGGNAAVWAALRAA